jgi:hypothetical protein
MQTSERIFNGEGSREGDDYHSAVFLIEFAAIDEVHIRLRFVLISPLEYFLQVPQLLVLRLLLQQAVNIGFEIVPLNEQTREIPLYLCCLLVVAIWISYQLFSNRRILQATQIIIVLLK